MPAESRLATVRAALTLAVLLSLVFTLLFVTTLLLFLLGLFEATLGLSVTLFLLACILSKLISTRLVQISVYFSLSPLP